MTPLFGKYRGTVTNNADPEGLFRIQALVPQILGTAACDWAWPCFPPGWSISPGALMVDHTFTDYNDGTASSGNHAQTLQHTLKLKVPTTGTGVWIEFEGGDVDKPIWSGVWKHF